MYRLKLYETFLKKVHIICEKGDYSIDSMSCITRIDKILIANRGEIARRIAKTARKLGVKTVADYSDVDKNSLHVELADEAYHIGPAPSAQSYLKQEKIINTAKNANCQAIHSGYGFLSENTEFAELCQNQNIIFIGPPAEVIRDMGKIAGGLKVKSRLKAIMAAAGVPIIEGYHGDDQSNGKLEQEAKKIGFPLMIKAVRGGAGKGMRIAWTESDFFQALESARTESEKSFGDSAVLLEQYVAEPRHVEVQIFADKYGNVVYSFERDCSVQRRHQKVIEEAPAPGISEELRAQLGEAAVRAAKAVGYVGAGTVEFIMDRHTQKFHFMEMNTRLQVEHPVTEAITGTDLVEWQLKVSAGEKLPLNQADIHLNGHSFEARVYAEDHNRGFLPGAGKLVHLTPPLITENVRVETGVRQNDEVSVHYDPMIAKLVAWGKDRNEALNIMKSKLSEYNIAGLETNIEFIKELCNPKFLSGEVHTGFIEENSTSLFPKIQVTDKILVQGALGLILQEQIDAWKLAIKASDPLNPFAIQSGLKLNHDLKRQLHFQIGEEKYFVDVRYIQPGVYSMKTNDLGPWESVIGTLKKQKNTTEIHSLVNGNIEKYRIVKVENELHLFTQERKWRLVIQSSKYLSELSNQDNVSSGAAVSPMPGVVEKILVKKGDSVKIGDPLIVIVAMKMEHLIKATSDGVIESVLCSVGENVAKSKLLVKFEDDVTI